MEVGRRPEPGGPTGTWSPSLKPFSHPVGSRDPSVPPLLPLTWSQRAICLVFHLETPVVRSRFMLPRNTTRFTLWFLQFASWWGQRVSEQGPPQDLGTVMLMVVPPEDALVQSKTECFFTWQKDPCRCD